MGVQKCEVVVVGLGTMGSAIADRLAMKGVDVIGLDRFDPPHDQGSMHGDTRITRQAIGEGDDYVPFVLATQNLWKELEREMSVPLFEQCGVVIIGNPNEAGEHHGKKGFLKETVDVAKKHGIEYSLLNREKLLNKFPQFVGMNEGDLAYYEPGGGFARPENCIATQLKHAKRYGARIFPNITVKNIQNTKTGVRVTTDKGTVEAKKVVVAAGAWVSDLLGERYKSLLTIRRQTLHWFILKEGQKQKYPKESPTFIWLHDEDLFYGFPPLPGEEAVKVATEQYVTSTTPYTIERSVSQDESDKMFSTHVNGRLLGATDKVLKAAGCMYTITPDQGFLLDYHPDMPNVFIVSACSGHGFKHSAGIGQAVAEEITGEKPFSDLSSFTFRRFFKPENKI